VAHDFNNVLSGIVSYPELLLLEIPPDSPMREPIESIQRAGLKAAAIVMDLLTLARRGVKTNEVVHLNDIVLDYLKSPEYATLKSFHARIDLETNLGDDLLNIMGSPFHLSKSLMNLVSNAAEAMPNGGKISVSTANLTIDSSVGSYDRIEEGDYVTLTVSDSGIGISPEDRERIFEPFYSKKVMGRSGTGLGLAVVWGTVKDYNGHIDLKSTVGKGSTFTLYFPVTREEWVKKESQLSVEEYKGRGESILVVDDGKEQREIASAILTQLGYSVTAVASGEEAVEYVKDHHVDLVVLDMIMAPGIDGLETYKRILKNQSRQRAIITSGFSETDHVKEAQNLGVGAYIKKPYTLEKLGMAIRSELEKA
jgi:Signal transduction histidine kinase